jgi:hypothetical protein
MYMGSKRRGLYQGLANIVFGVGSGLGGPLGEFGCRFTSRLFVHRFM